MATRTVDRGAADQEPTPITAVRPVKANPLREGLRLERMAEPCTMVICGATGDLTERKLGPALYNTLLGGFLPPEFTVVGFARRDLTDEQFREHLLEGINKYSRNRPAKPAIWDSFAKGIEYHRGDFDDRPPTSSSASASIASIVTAVRPATGSSTSPSRPTSTPRSSTSSTAPAWPRPGSGAAAAASAAGRG
jgi:hypothetical protein